MKRHDCYRKAASSLRFAQHLRQVSSTPLFLCLVVPLGSVNITGKMPSAKSPRSIEESLSPQSPLAQSGRILYIIHQIVLLRNTITSGSQDVQCRQGESGRRRLASAGAVHALLFLRHAASSRSPEFRLQPMRIRFMRCVPSGGTTHGDICHSCAGLGSIQS